MIQITLNLTLRINKINCLLIALQNIFIHFFNVFFFNVCIYKAYSFQFEYFSVERWRLIINYKYFVNNFYGGLLELTEFTLINLLRIEDAFWLTTHKIIQAKSLGRKRVYWSASWKIVELFNFCIQRSYTYIDIVYIQYIIQYVDIH